MNTPIGGTDPFVATVAAMADRISAVLDHVAVAVPSVEPAQQRWISELGGGLVTKGGNDVFRSRQIRFANGGRLELLTPAPKAGEGSFVSRFLQRFGSTVHHVTLKVPDLHAALDVVASGGLEPVDVSDENEQWQEAFLRPSQIGGIVVQVAASTLTEQDWSRLTGFEPQQPRADAASLLGPRLRHPDLDHAAAIWTLLGASVTPSAEALYCSWPDSPLTIAVETGEPAGPVALRMDGAAALPARDGVGPAVEVP